MYIVSQCEPHCAERVERKETGIETRWGTNPVASFAYDHDAAGRRTRRVDSELTTNLFGYNMRSELVNAIMGTNFYAYDYDSIGNRRVASMGAVSNVYEANSLNQYSTISNSLPPAAIRLQYDPDGNLVADGTWVYAWDAENRLVGVSPATTNVGSVRLSFAYDYMSRRVKKEVETHDGSAWSHTLAVFYTYDGWNLVCEDASNAPKKNYYVWGLDLSGTLQGAGGVGGLLARVRADNIPQPLYYSCDANGNVTDVLDKNGAVVAHYEYDPYGNTIAQSGDQADENPFRFSSKYWDGETGFYYYGYRFYNPALGRWLSRDPIQEWSGMNIYEFVRNLPINFTDRLGLDINVPNDVIFSPVDGSSTPQPFSERNPRYENSFCNLPHYNYSDTHYLISCRDGDSCEVILEKINALIKSLKIRRSELEYYSTVGQPWKDYWRHVIQYEQQATMLLKCQFRYITHEPPCCGKVPEYNAYPYPKYKWAKPKNENLNNFEINPDTVYGLGVAATVGYHTVRTILRFTCPPSNLVPIP